MKIVKNHKAKLLIKKYLKGIILCYKTRHGHRVARFGNKYEVHRNPSLIKLKHKM